MPKDVADLDAMLLHKDYMRLTDRLKSANTAQDVGLDLDWEQTRVFDGAGFLVAMGYMTDLWRLGSALPPPDKDQLKQSAAMMFLYQLDLIVIDGARCDDVSAPGHRRDQLVFQNQAMVQYLRALPRATRMNLGSVSLAIEAATGSGRRDDDVLCSGGMAQMNAALAAQGDKPLPELHASPEHFGGTYAVPPAPGFKPQFVNPAVSGPRQVAARRDMPAALTRFLTVPEDPPAPPAAK